MSCYAIDVVDSYVREIFNSEHDDVLHSALVNDCMSNYDKFGLSANLIETINELNSREQGPWKPKYLNLELPSGGLLPSHLKASEVELKPLPENLKYAFVGANDTLPVIIANTLNEEQERRLIKVLKKHREAIGWSIADIKGISPSTCMHRILLEDNAKPVRQPQRRLKPPMMEVVKKEVLKIYQAGMIYPISDSKWVSPTQVVPKKSGMTVVERFVEVFMDDFTVHGDSFDECLNHLELVLMKCIEANLVLNSEKCHFMVDHGIVLGHVVSFKGLEIDKAKVDAIQTLPYPTSVRDIRSFLGHAGFYCRFIKDFSHIAIPLCKLLQKDTLFHLDEPCKVAFDLLKKKLREAPRIRAPIWTQPFEIECHANELAIGTTLRQRSGTTLESYTMLR